MPLCCKLQAQGDSLSWAANSSLNFFAHLTSMKQVAPVHSAGAWAGARARQAMGPPCLHPSQMVEQPSMKYMEFASSHPTSMKHIFF